MSDVKTYPGVTAVKHDEAKPAIHLIDVAWMRALTNALDESPGMYGRLEFAVRHLELWASGPLDYQVLVTAAAAVAQAVNADAPALTAELELGRVLEFGARKYDPTNWRKGMAWSRLYRAARGHIQSHRRGDIYDLETGYLHLSHALACLMFLAVSQRDGLGADDRGTLLR